MTGVRAPGIWRFLVGLGAVIGLLTAIVATPLGQPIAVVWATPVQVEISTTEVPAGGRFDVAVMAAAPDESIVELGVFGALNTTLLTTSLEDGAANFTIDGVHTRHSGVITVVASVLGNSSVPADIGVVPLEAVEPVVPLVGPRTIVADGADITMVTVSPADRYGNAVSTGTDVMTTLTRADGSVERRADPVAGGVAATIATATTETGRVTVSTTVGTAGGPSNVFDEVAGRPADFRVEIDTRNPIADGFNLRDVQTTTLRDRYGNLLPDGVAAVFTVESEAGSTFVHTTVQGGIARTRIKAPGRPGVLTIQALVSGAESELTSLRFDPAVDVVPVATATVNDITTFTVGPVQSTLGGYVPDGTTVVVYDSSAEVLASAEVRGGFGEVTLEGYHGMVEIDVLGLRTTVSIDRTGP